MLERDRGEMPVHRRKSKDQTYYAKKMLAYHEANRVGEHVQELGMPNFRVLTVTTTPARVEQMIEAQEGNDGWARIELVPVHRSGKFGGKRFARRSVDDREG